LLSYAFHRHCMTHALIQSCRPILSLKSVEALDQGNLGF
jgi:hypothetical protein